MIKIEKAKKGNKVLVFFMSLVCLLTVFSTSIYAADRTTSVNISIKQTFTVNDKKNAHVSNEFSYKMTAIEAGNPMPMGSVDNTYAFSIAGNSKIDIGPISYNAVGIYHYQIEQSVENNAEHYIYDKSVYTVTVYVINADSNGIEAQIVVENINREKVATLSYQNSYEDLTGNVIEPPKPSKEVETPKPSSVNTGDTNDFSVIIASLAISLAGICVLLVVKKKKEEA